MKIWNGLDAEHVRVGGRTLLRARRRGEGEWAHPWALDVLFAAGGWRAYVEPGFVNGRDAFTHFTADMLDSRTTTTGITYADFGTNPLTGRPFFSDPVFKQNSKAETTTESSAGTQSSGILVPLTHDPRPFFLLDSWRDPVQSTGFAEGTEGVVTLAGEGYPAFFAGLGVMPAAKASTAQRGAADDASRTRQIRAADVVLRIPRIGTRLQYTVLNNLLSTQTQAIDTIFTTNYYNAVEGKAILRVTDKFVPPTADNSIPGIYGQLLDTGSAEYDDVLMATIYMVSPPGAGGEPDGTWEAWPQYRVFWNLNSATNVVPQNPPSLAIKLPIPLAGGLAQPAFDAILLAVNDIGAEAAAFAFAAKAAGHQWSG